MGKLKKEQFVIDKNGGRVGVLLDIKTYEKMLEDLEEPEDIRAYDQAKDKVQKEVKRGNFINLEDYRANKHWAQTPL